MQYVVVGKSFNQAMELGSPEYFWKDKKCAPLYNAFGVLAFGNYGTLFNNKKVAQRAIKRSLRYAKQYDHNWGDSSDYVICGVK